MIYNLRLLVHPQSYFSKVIYFSFCKSEIDQNKSLKEVKKKNSSIMPKFEQGFAYGHYFPKEWSQEKIHKVLDPTFKEVERVSIVKTKVGENSGKVLIKFKDQLIRKKYIDKYNEDFIFSDSQSQKVVILPFQLKTIEQKKNFKEGKNFKYPVRISNLDFDITQNQLLKLAVDYGDVSHIDINYRQSGINKGFATIFFQTAKSALQFVNFLDGLMYRDRKLKAHLQIKRLEKTELKLLETPTFTFKANQELMKKIKSNQFQQK